MAETQGDRDSGFIQFSNGVALSAWDHAGLASWTYRCVGWFFQHFLASLEAQADCRYSATLSHLPQAKS